MTKEETKRRAEIMLAAEYDGDTCVNIECRSSGSGKWTKMYGPLWNWVNFDYRVIPKPQTIYLKVFDDGDSMSDKYLDHLKPFDDAISVLKITIVDGKPTAEFIDMESVE